MNISYFLVMIQFYTPTPLLIQMMHMNSQTCSMVPTDSHKASFTDSLCAKFFSANLSFPFFTIFKVKWFYNI